MNSNGNNGLTHKIFSYSVVLWWWLFCDGKERECVAVVCGADGIESLASEMASVIQNRVK